MEFARILLSDNIVGMQYEIVVIFVLLLIPAVKISDEKHLAVIWGGIFLFFVYIHRALLPFIVSGIWCLMLAGAVFSLIKADIGASLTPAKRLKARAAAFLSPDMRPYAVIILIILLIQICRINIALDYDSLRYGLRSDVLITDGTLKGFFDGLGLVNTVYTYPKGFEVLTLPLLLISSESFGYALCFNIWILILVMLCAGETAQLIYCVVTGEEAHKRPDDDKPYGKAVSAAGKSQDHPGFMAGGLICVIISLIPGITNMSITAKSDLSTLLTQLIFIYCVAAYLETQDKTLTGAGVGALILSYAFKPTALVFSTAIGIAALIYLRVCKIGIRWNAAGIRAAGLAFIFTGIMTLRTFLITGIPFTSVFTGVFEKMGFVLGYPFRENDALGGSGAGFTLDGMENYLVRVLKFLVCPTGEDMDHVIMAWGGLVFVLLLAAALLLIRKISDNADFLSRLYDIRSGEDSERAEDTHPADPAGTAHGAPCSADKLPLYRRAVLMCRFIYTEFLLTGALALISLWILYQVDGNYFMLLYALTAVAGGTALLIGEEANDILAASGRRDTRRKRLKLTGGANFGIVIVSVVMIYFTAVTSWSGAVGFTDADILNKGYYNHEVEYGLKNPLNWDKHTRVVAFAYEPDCYRLRGRVESWVDIDGAGGNVYLTDTKLDIFKEYMSFADIDYIYADIHFLNDVTDSRRIRAGVLFGYLLEDGCFEDIFLEENSSNYLFCRIDKERMGESWEVDMGSEREERTEAQVKYFEEIAK